MTMQKRKILFIADGKPIPANAGGILYGKIIKVYGVESMQYIEIGWKYSKNELPKIFKNLKIKRFSFRLPIEGKIGKYLRKIPTLETIFMICSRQVQLRRILYYVKELNCDIIFAVLRSDSLLVLNKIVDTLNIPLVGFISDTVETEDADHKYIYKIKYEEYYKVINKCSVLAVAGETMRDHFREIYHNEPVILRLGFRNQSDLINKQIKNELNIVFSGSMYAKDELLQFLIACDKYALMDGKIHINIYIASNGEIKNKYKKIKIKNLGWIDEINLYEVFKISHISYLPYKFNKNAKFRMKYAFPNKSGLYTSFRLPIFFHGPEYSSFNNFLKQYKVGTSCNSLNIERIISKLDILIKDDKYYQKCQYECQRAFENEFSDEVFYNTVNKLFNF